MKMHNETHYFLLQQKKKRRNEAGTCLTPLPPPTPAPQSLVQTAASETLGNQPAGSGSGPGD